jgi:hypothetical protein
MYAPTLADRISEGLGKVGLVVGIAVTLLGFLGIALQLPH